jgi:hypothetical protein
VRGRRPLLYRPGDGAGQRAGRLRPPHRPESGRPMSRIETLRDGRRRALPHQHAACREQ